MDVLVSKLNGTCQFSVYRKPTFTNLGTSFFSFVPNSYKVNAIKTLIHRAYNLSSNWTLFHSELEKLKNFFYINGYPSGLIEGKIGKFLDEKINPKPMITTVQKEILYVKLPFLGSATEKSLPQLRSMLYRYYPQLEFRFHFESALSIGSFFRGKDRIPDELKSNIVYKYTCDTCQASYVGSSTKQAKVRFSQHLGISPRTMLPLNSPPFSSIRNHCYDQNHRIKISNFSIICTSKFSDIRTLESLYIHNLKPTLNLDQSASQLLTT